MTPERQFRRNLRALTWSVAVIALSVSLLFTVVFRTVRNDQIRLIDRQLRYHNVILELQGAIGYGGLIHHFKNWILRPEEPKYRDMAIASADRALALLGVLHTELGNAGIDISLEHQRAVLQGYRDNVDVITRMHHQGADLHAIDDAVRINDMLALDEIAVLKDRMLIAMRVQQARLETRKLLLYLLPFGLLVVLALTMLVLVRQRAQLRFEHDAARIDEMEKFTQIAVHDLRAPLRQISTLAEFAREDIKQDDSALHEAIAANLACIMDRAEKLDALVLSVFRYITVEGASHEVSDVDLRQLVNDIAGMHLPESATLTMEGEFPTVRAQRLELEIILRNLMSNAVKHHPQKCPHIVVRHRYERHRHCFEVQDNGPGVDEQFREKVFEMFWSLKARDLPGEVAGVGLALVRRIILKWGADLSLTNVSPNGALFRFTMPRF